MDVADSRLTMATKNINDTLQRHLPWGPPTTNMTTCLLAQEDYVIGYSEDYHLPLWAAFTITKVIWLLLTVICCCVDQGCARGIFSRDRGETKTWKRETEAKTKTFSLEAEARPRRLKFQPRQDRAEALLRLETASRPRRQDRDHIPVVFQIYRVGQKTGPLCIFPNIWKTMKENCMIFAHITFGVY